MTNWIIRPDPYAGFTDDRERRLALVDRHRRDERIVRYRVCGGLVLSILLSLARPDLWPFLLAWLGGG